MALPKIDVRGRKIVLLTGFPTDKKGERKVAQPLSEESERELRLAALRHPDAVAFGYVSGQWVAAA